MLRLHRLIGSGWATACEQPVDEVLLAVRNEGAAAEFLSRHQSVCPCTQCWGYVSLVRSAELVRLAEALDNMPVKEDRSRVLLLRAACDRWLARETDARLDTLDPRAGGGTVL